MATTIEHKAALFFPAHIESKTLKVSSVAVLTSGGIESASLVCVLAEYFASVHPIYVRFGLAWEKIELQLLLKYLDAVNRPNIQPLKLFDLPVGNIYGKNWSTTGKDVPDASTNDEAVYLPGRNILLMAQTAVWCALNQIRFVALGSLGTNPFADSSPQFFNQLQNTLSSGLNFDLTILSPFSAMHKEEVILLAKDLPLHLTFSCLSPIPSENEAAAALHCGICNKCAERQNAFNKAQIEDKTIYAFSMPVTALFNKLSLI